MVTIGVKMDMRMDAEELCALDAAASALDELKGVMAGGLAEAYPADIAARTGTSERMAAHMLGDLIEDGLIETNAEGTAARSLTALGEAVVRRVAPTRESVETREAHRQ